MSQMNTNIGRDLYVPPSPAGQIATDVAGTAANGLVQAGLSFIPGGGVVSSFANQLGFQGQLRDMEQMQTRLLGLQMQVQRMTTQYEAETNISKTAHDAHMSAVRNIKA